MLTQMLLYQDWKQVKPIISQSSALFLFWIIKCGTLPALLQIMYMGYVVCDAEMTFLSFTIPKTVLYRRQEQH